MSELQLFDPGPLPAYLTKFLEEEKNIVDRVTVPSLSYEGKTWTIVLNGEKTRIERKNADGDIEPVSIMRAIILDYAKQRGRAFYEGAYDSKKPGKPTCWSDNGITPDEGITEPQASKCDGCPQSIKGSKINENGVAGVACSQHRMVVIVPAAEPDYTPLRMKLAITSDYDGKVGEHEKEGWFAFSNYVKFLQSRGISHTGAVITKMKFDPSTPYPKVLFSADKLVDQKLLPTVAKQWRSDETKALISGTWTPAGVDGERVAPKEEAKPEENKAAEQAAAKAKAEAEAKAAAAKSEATKAKAEAKAKAAAKARADAEAAEAEAAEPEKEVKKDQETASEIPDDVADLLSEWGSEE